MTSYGAGELVYYPANVNARVYMSLVNNNVSTPSLTAPTYDAAAVYNPGDFVTSSSVVYESIWPVGDNVGNTPVSSPLYWLAVPLFVLSNTYALNDVVFYTDVLYKSLVGTNTNHQVDSSPTYWQVLQPDLALGQWQLLDATMVPVVNPAPVYNGAAVFPLPTGFIRGAPQNPKAGSYSDLGAPTNVAYSDFLFEGPYIISGTGSLSVPFRFVADVSDESQFDPMFAEGFACRIGAEVCEPITQSSVKIDTIERKYAKLMTEARLVNGVETGPEEPPMDEFLSVRY